MEYNKLDIAELEKEFEEYEKERYGEEESDEEYEENPNTITLAAVVKETISSYINYCAHHYIKSRSRTHEDDASYFNTKEELKAFYKRFKELNGDPNTLHCGVVYKDNGEFSCYEVCRKKYYDNPKFRKYFFS